MDQDHINHLVFLAKHGGVAKRAGIATFKRIPKNILADLAKDDVRSVRFAVVQNPEADSDILEIGSVDSDPVIQNIAMIRLGLFDQKKLKELSKNSSTALARYAKEALRV